MSGGKFTNDVQENLQMTYAHVGRHLLPEDYKIWRKFRTMNRKEQMKALKEDKVTYHRVKQNLGRMLNDLNQLYDDESLECILDVLKEQGKVKLILIGHEPREVTLGDLS